MQKFSYTFSAAGIIGGLSFMDDMFGVVGMVAREWALLSAFLPTIGLMMAVGSTVWLGLCLSIDVTPLRSTQDKGEARLTEQCHDKSR